MFRIVILLLTALLGSLSTLSCFAMTEKRIGIGAIIDSSAGFLVPIEFNEWLIEPTISGKKSKTNSTAGLDGSRTKKDTRTLTLAVGIYKNTQLAESTFLYYGARIGVTKRRTKEKREQSVLFPSLSSESDEDGYFLAPTMGVQYYFIPEFSVGIDLTFQYTKVEGDESETSEGVTLDVNVDSASYATTASVIVRYMF